MCVCVCVCRYKYTKAVLYGVRKAGPFFTSLILRLGPVSVHTHTHTHTHADRQTHTHTQTLHGNPPLCQPQGTAQHNQSLKHQVGCDVCVCVCVSQVPDPITNYMMGIPPDHHTQWFFLKYMAGSIIGTLPGIVLVSTHTHTHLALGTSTCRVVQLHTPTHPRTSVHPP